MKRLLVGAAVGMLALMTVAGPASARTFGAVYANDAIYRVFGNAANVRTARARTRSRNSPIRPMRISSASPIRAWFTDRPPWRSLGRLHGQLDFGRPLDPCHELVPARVARVERPAESGAQRGGRLPLPRPRRSPNRSADGRSSGAAPCVFREPRRRPRQFPCAARRASGSFSVEPWMTKLTATASAAPTNGPMT